MNRKYLLDTGAASDCINRRGSTWMSAREAICQGATVGICVPVLAELFAGIELSHTRDVNLERLERFLPNFRIWPFDLKAAHEYGQLFAHLRRSGRPMQQIDIQVAAITLSLGNCTLVSKDRDFLAIPSLNLVDWSTRD